jgi:hypothetical protein
MNSESKQQLLFKDEIPESVCQNDPIEDLWQERNCPDCDCELDVAYDSGDNPKYYCDNCGCSVLGPVALSMGDMDISQENDA